MEGITFEAAGKLILKRKKYIFYEPSQILLPSRRRRVRQRELITEGWGEEDILVLFLDEGG